MDYKRSGHFVVLRLDEGDEITASLKKVCLKERVHSALVSGIGACRKAEIAHYNPKTKEYKINKLAGALEIVSLNGNIALLDGKPAQHLHVILSIEDFSTLSGHLMKAEIYPTCEITLILRDVKVRREKDKKTGLNLQRF
jgi:predicted DNA-binding protein with PD1-like motif